MPTISSFRANYYFLSNFYPCSVRYNDITFPSVEHAFQAAKSNDPYYQQRVAGAKDARTAKAMGRQCQLRSDWEQVKTSIMVGLLEQKFAPGSDLATALIDTSPSILLEGNTWHDNYWGSCTCRDCKYMPGQNMLGKLLMARRAVLML